MAHPKIRELQLLSDDAKVILIGPFMFGDKASISYGGLGAENELTPRMVDAVCELVEAGFVTTETDTVGRNTLRGVAGNNAQAVARLVNDPFKFVEENGGWSMYQPKGA